MIDPVFTDVNVSDFANGWFLAGSSDQVRTQPYGQTTAAASSIRVPYNLISSGLHSRQFSIPAISTSRYQEWTQISSTPATCEDYGITTYRALSLRDPAEEKTEETNPLGHSYKYTVKTEATCAKNGVKTGTCSRCGDTVTETIPATGTHQLSWVTVTAATCSAEGKRADAQRTAHVRGTLGQFSP